MAKKYRLRERAHSELLQDLLHVRGVVGDEAQKNFLNPDFMRDSGDPFLLPDMGVAVERIIAAIKNGEQICVWSDYDCDGIPGGVMLTSFLRSAGARVRHYIPHRHKEGYGLNPGGIDELAAANTTLIITIDLGTTEHENVAYAKEKGIDIIITDHHVAGEELPPALAVINPKRQDSKYGFDGLCGAGVAWKLVQGILAKERFGVADGQEKWLLDLVGMATLSDMVPLVGENRMLAHFGLTVMRRGRRPGLSSLLSLLRIKPSSLTEDDIGFMVAPRINAASRMDSPEIAARLLAAESAEEGAELARTLNRINDERKGLVAATVKEVNKRMHGASTESPVIVMGNPEWRPGILGLVANSLVEAHGKPAFVWGREGGELIRGSVRGTGGVSVVEMMQGAAEVFDHFGGHHASGGFSLAQERVHELAPALVRAYEALKQEGTAVPEVVLERELEVAEVPHAKRELAKLAPFGEGNTKPLFIFPAVSLGNIRAFGKTQNHLDIALEKGGERVAGIAFFSTPESFTKRAERGTRADIVGHVEADWRGAPRIRVVDIL